MNFDGEFVNKETWNLFRERFKSDTTEAGYLSDIREFFRLTGKPAEKAGSGDVKKYYEYMQGQAEKGRISPITITKKFRELHSYVSFAGAEDFFYPLLKTMAVESAEAGHVPVEDMDALLKAAAGDRMTYTILVLMYRAGLTSTEVIALRGEEEFIKYDEGVYVMPEGRKEPCYIPEDAWKILSEYTRERDVQDTLFYNRRGRPLNVMYISRMMKKYCTKAGIRSYSAQDVRNSCAFNLFAYGASPVQVADQMGRTEQQIRRYRGTAYRGSLKKKTADLVKIRIEEP